MSNNNGNFWGATLLISGTCIGGGMLALPVDTSLAGFIPSSLAMLVTWAFMTLTALYLIEANLWMEEGTHIMTMASRLLGRFGKYLSLGLFLFMAYASLVAYVTGGGKLIENLFKNFFDIPVVQWEGSVIFTIVFGFILFLGTKFLGRVNGVLVVGMIMAYLGLIISGVTEIRLTNLVRESWGSVFTTLPILLTIFSFQMIVPSLTPYLNRDARKCRNAILLGTFIPLIVYLIWQWIVLGSITFEGEFGLSFAKEQGHPATESIRHAVDNSIFVKFSDFFAFFAIVTSFLGISLSLYDFLADSLKITKKGMRKLGLGALVLLPSLIFGIIFPRAFILSLEVTGGFGDAILNGMLPILMVYSGRYYLNKKGPYRMWGDKFLMYVLLAFSCLVVTSQIKNILSHW
ncbi:MAG: amino acid transporter [Chlamydiae bacterium CG10_big_fil_rev_8_21_14_0_10_35_9]|nr:MAG: amino acid transporter [Chlamydiae bacterium CG10_big_fil_rev_8_21_14_0_10_35_9]